jgi:NTP pyrophosphatase (non-canonical NTP hydrolase)
MTANNSNLELAKIQQELARFSSERNWEQFHSIKNLSMALTGEAGELLELLQWLTEKESNSPDQELKGKITEELSDIFLYLLRMSDILDIDLIKSGLDKIKINAEKYPIHKSYGNSKKYTDFKN